MPRFAPTLLLIAAPLWLIGLAEKRFVHIKWESYEYAPSEVRRAGKPRAGGLHAIVSPERCRAKLAEKLHHTSFC